jgi:hypothetical protein
MRFTTKLFFLLCTLCGCAVQLTALYDPVIDEGITQVQETMDIHLIHMQHAQAPFTQGFYDSVLAKLSVLQTRAAAMPMDETTVKDIQRIIADADSTDATEQRGAGSALFFIDIQQRLDDDCGRALKVELARKR